MSFLCYLDRAMINTDPWPFTSLSLLRENMIPTTFFKIELYTGPFKYIPLS